MYQYLPCGQRLLWAPAAGDGGCGDEARCGRSDDRSFHLGDAAQHDGRGARKRQSRHLQDLRGRVRAPSRLCDAALLGQHPGQLQGLGRKRRQSQGLRLGNCHGGACGFPLQAGEHAHQQGSPPKNCQARHGHPLAGGRALAVGVLRVRDRGRWHVHVIRHHAGLALLHRWHPAECLGFGIENSGARLVGGRPACHHRPRHRRHPAGNSIYDREEDRG
mmetsp:Transcript_83335/g.236161  ORF Transcript_83335/g.236161 Transcript_83335/m.236161 type:complete len:218 (-) Transcript_83335:616-1269(-)